MEIFSISNSRVPKLRKNQNGKQMAYRTQGGWDRTCILRPEGRKSFPVDSGMKREILGKRDKRNRISKHGSKRK